MRDYRTVHVPNSALQVTLFRDFIEDRRTSMEVYAHNLLANLRALDRGDFVFREFRPVLNGIIHRLPETANLRMRTARYMSYPHQARTAQRDIHHILDHGYAHLLSVLDPRKTIITVHDIIPILAGRGLIPGIQRQRRSWLSEWSARFYRRAARLIAISENTKRDLVRHCGCDPERIQVIYYGINPAFRPYSIADCQQFRQRLGLPARQFLILITGQQYYKNQATSLKVLQCLLAHSGDGIRLVRLGRPTAQWQADLARSGIADKVIHLDFLTAEDMPSLYNAVDCLLFPSWYEGFGMPPTEAMACGTPAVTSNAASLPEAVGEAGLTAAPDDVEQLAAHVARLLEDPEFRQDRIRRGLDHVKRFTWERNATRVMELYQAMAEQKHNT